MAIITRFKSLNPPRQRRSQKRQNSVPADRTIGLARPVGQGLKKSEESENTTSNTHPSDATHSRREQHVSSRIQEANRPTAGSDQYTSPPVHSDEPVPATGDSKRHTGVDMRLAQERFKRSAAPKSHPSLGNFDTEEGIRNVPQGTPSMLQKSRGGIGAIKSFTTRIHRYTRRGSKIEDSIASASTTQLSPVRGYAGGSQLTPAGAKVIEQTATESEEIKKLRQDLSHSQSQIAELKRRCEAQSRDLDSSNTFLNTADQSSDSDVIHVLQRLNAEAQQNTTYMADFLAETFEFIDSTTSPAKEQISAAQRASGHIGQVLMKSLETITRDDVPMLLQIAFQAYLASVLCQTASSWTFEPRQNAFINDIYQRLRRAEAQAISGRWRTLARVHTVHNWITHPESLVKAIITDICDILLVAGCTAPQSDIISKITSKFEERIALLVELAGRLNKLFDEVISSDFEAFVVRPGEKFDGERMEKELDDGQTGIQEASVLCTTHLGLIKRIPVGTLWERGKKRKMIVLKARVVPESFLNTED